MPTSRSLREFGARLNRIAARYGAQVDEGVRRVALATFRTAILATPVDTGRARIGWIGSLGSPTDVDVPPVEAGQRGSASRAQANTRVPADVIDRTPRDGKVFLTNNVEYIGFLERGSSVQAPRGMTQLALLVGLAQAARETPLRRAVRGR